MLHVLSYVSAWCFSDPMRLVHRFCDVAPEGSSLRILFILSMNSMISFSPRIYLSFQLDLVFCAACTVFILSLLFMQLAVFFPYFSFSPL